MILFFITTSSFFLSAQNTDEIHLKESTNEYTRLFNKALELKNQGEFRDSIALFIKALELSKENADRKRECRTCLELGILYWNTGDLKKSSDFHTRSLELSNSLSLEKEKKINQKALKIIALLEEGIKHRQKGEIQACTNSIQEAIKLSRAIKSREHELKCLRRLSLSYWKLNNIEKFYSLNTQALEIARKINHIKEESKCLNNIGLCYWKFNNYSKALHSYEKALAIARHLGNKEDQSACLNNIGIIYENTGHYEKSLYYLKKALKIDRELSNDVFISMDLNNIGETLRSNGLATGKRADLIEALGYFKECLELTQKTGDKKTEAQVLHNLGTVHSDLENYLKALDYFRSALNIAEQIQDFEAIAMILNNTGITHYKMGNYKKSTQYYQRAIDTALKISGENILWESWLESAKSFEKQKKIKKAFKNYEYSISVIENIRAKIKLEELKATYLGTYKRIEAYHRLINLIINHQWLTAEKDYKSLAFDYMERSKARAFLDSLEISRINIANTLPEKTKNEEKALMKEISYLYTKLLKSEFSEGSANEIHEKLKRIEHKLDSLKREMRTKNPSYINLKYPEIISSKEAQKKLLHSGDAVFEYCIGKESSYLFVLTKNNLEIFNLPKKQRIQKQVSQYLKDITDRENNNFEEGYKLFQVLIKPGLKRNMKNLIIIPDDILHFLPFETLLEKQNSREWLINHYAIYYSPSLSLLNEIINRNTLKKKNPKKDILAIGDPYIDIPANQEKKESSFSFPYDFNFFPLKYSNAEINKISSLFDSSKKSIFLGEKATEETFKKQDLSEYKIIHFATHSLIDEKQPARSSIVLSLDDNPEEDGLLQMREIFNLKLNSRLVTLSSCQTGMGKFITGEGIESLNRAFFYAGASSVIISLWSVNDQASSLLMEQFYSHLCSSHSPAESIRKAKKSMIKSETFSHPFYWAAFIVTGDSDKNIIPQSKTKFLLLALILIAATTLSIFIINKSKKIRSS